MDNLPFLATILSIAKQFNISAEKAASVYLDFVKHKNQQLEEHLGSETMNKLKDLLADEPSVEELIDIYHELKRNRELVPASLVKTESLYLRSLDTIGNKVFPAGTPIEVTKDWLGNTILEIWVDGGCCTYINADLVLF